MECGVVRLELFMEGFLEKVLLLCWLSLDDVELVVTMDGRPCSIWLRFTSTLSNAISSSSARSGCSFMGP